MEHPDIKKAPGLCVHRSGAPQNQGDYIMKTKEKQQGMQKPSYWALIPATVRYDADLPPNAKLLYAEITALSNAQGYCSATNAYFAALYGLGDKSIGRLISTLAKSGYLLVEVIRDEKQEVQGRKLTPVYGANAMRTPPHKIEGTPPRKKAGTPPPKIGEKNIYNNINNIPPTPQGGKESDVLDMLFERFWKAYPPRNGKRRGKAQAQKAWNKLKPDLPTCRRMAAALESDKQSDEWQRENGRFIPMASTWLNGRRWEDEPVEPEQPAAKTAAARQPKRWHREVINGEEVLVPDEW